MEGGGFGMSSIDERIVGMQFDNAQFEKGLGTSIKSLGQLEKSLDLKGGTKGLTGIASAAGKLSFDGLAKAAETVNSRLSNLGIMGVAALTRIANSAIDAGVRIAKSLSVDPIMAGFQEYELKMGSIQTILANTARHGTRLDEVSQNLEALNTYADKTIYNFGEMTRNIGLFTNAGIKVDEATQMIKGFSNMAAASGTDSAGASRAAYQLSQALSTGTIRLMDWRSLTNVGMGNKVMQQDLLTFAEAMGTVSASGAKASDIQKDFNGSLEKGWLSADVMSTYLQVMAEDNEDVNRATLKSIGIEGKKADALIAQQKTAFDAATKVRTWTQLLGTLQESVGSGWGKTFELLIGDFEQATELFTAVNNSIGPMIDDMSDMRNNLLQGWVDLGGRTKALEAFASLWKGLGEILKPISKAFGDVFKPLKPEQLMAVTNAFKNFADKLRPTEEQVSQLRDAFRGVFSIFSIAGKVIGAAVSIISRLLGVVAPAGGSFLKFAAGIGKWIYNVDQAITKADIFAKIGDAIVAGFQKAVDFIVDFGDKVKASFSGAAGFIGSVVDALNKANFKSLADGIGQTANAFAPLRMAGAALKWFGGIVATAYQAVAPYFSKIASAIGNFVSAIRDKFDDFRKNADIEKALGIFNSGLFSVVLLKIIGFFKGLQKTSEDSGSIKDGIKNVLGGITDTLGQMQNTLKASTLLMIGAAIYILADAAAKLSTINAGDLTKSLTAITVMVGQLLGMMAAVDGIMKGGGKGILSAGAALVIFAAAIRILAGAVEKLGGMNLGDLAKGLGAVMVLLASLTGVAKALSANSGTFMKGAMGLIPFAFAIKILADAVEKLSGIELGNLAKGLGGTIVLLGALAKFLSNPKMGSMGIKTGAGLLLLAVSLNVLATAVEKLSGIELGNLAKGVGAISAIILVLAGFTAIAGGAKGMVGIGLGMIALGAAMLVMSKALEAMGSLSMEQIGKGLLALAGSLVIIAVAMKLMTTALAGAAALLVVAIALKVLAPVLEQLGNMSMEQIGKGLLVLAGSLLILAGGLYLMSGALPGAAALLVAAAALNVLLPVLQAFGSMSMEEIGKGLLMLVGTMAAFGIGALLLIPAVPVFLALGAAMLVFGAGVLLLGAGIAALSSGLLVLAAAGTAGAAAITVALSAFIGMIPYLIQQIGVGFVAFLGVIASSGAAIVAAVVTLLGSLIEAIVTLIPQIVDAAVQIGSALLEGFSELSGDLIDAAVQLIFDLVDAILEIVPELVDAGMQLIEGILQGIADNIDGVISAGADIVVNFMDGLAEEIPRVGESATNLIKTFVTTLVDSVIASKDHIKSEGKRLLDSLTEGAFSGITEGAGKIPGHISGFIGKITSSISAGASSLFSSAFGVAGNIVRGLVSGIRNGIGQVTSAARNIAQNALDAAKNLLGIASPSKEFIKIGKFVRQGFVIGLMSGDKDEVIKAYSSMKDQVEKLKADSKADAKKAEERLKSLEARNKKLRKAKNVDRAAVKKNEREQAEQRKILKTATEEQIKAEKALAKLRGAGKKGLKDEYIALKAAAKQYEKLAEKLEAAKDAYDDAKKVRDDYSKSISDQYSSLASIPTNGDYKEYVEAIAEGMTDAKTPFQAYHDGMKQQVEDINLYAAKVQQARKLGLNDTMYKKLLESGTEALPFVEELLKGGAGAITDINTLSDDIELASSKLGKKASSNLYQAGVDAAKGIVEGLKSEMKPLEKVMTELANKIVGSLKKSLKIKSPSRVMAELGKFTGKGLAEGLTSTAKEVEKASDIVSSTTIDSMKQAILEAQKMANTGVGTDLTIRPTVDLEEVKRGMAAMRGLLNDESMVASDYRRATSLARDIRKAQEANDTTVSSGSTSSSGNGVTFNQYNSSPAALSAADIYRQTRNQLSRIKEKLEV